MSEPHNTNQCRHLNAAGRRCRMPVAPAHDTLCAHHLQQQTASQPDPEAVAAELLDRTGNLNTAERVNALLANTVRQLARKRIDRQDALAIGYLAQLLLNTVPGVQKEYQAIRASQAKQAIRKSFAESRSASQARLRAPQPGSQPVTQSAPEPATQPTATPKTVAQHNPSAPPSHLFGVPRLARTERSERDAAFPPGATVVAGPSDPSPKPPEEVLLETVLQTT